MSGEDEKPRLPRIPGGFIHSADQAEAASEAVAKVISIYYRRLRDLGIPEELAGKLASEYQHLMFTVSRPQ